MEWFQEVTDAVLPRDQLTGTLLRDLHDPPGYELNDTEFDSR